MNNTDFQRLVTDTPKRGQDASRTSRESSNASSSFGSRHRSNIPMTPRSVKGQPSLDFARQLAEERNGAQQRSRKFKSSAAPKGTKLAAGYHDRTQDRDKTADNGKESRIKALEEQVKLGQIERDVFEKMRDEIIGGELSSTHLVKGLDRRLLERVRQGEDVYDDKREDELGKKAAKTISEDAGEELEAIEARQVVPIAKARPDKKGEMAPPPRPVAGVKRSRNDILAELRASREDAATVHKPVEKEKLGANFRRMGEKPKYPRIESDHKGREVLITLDENGREKRKVRKVVHKEDKISSPVVLPMPEKGAKPLGMEVPDQHPEPLVVEDGDEDIFEGVGNEYDPLGAMSDGDEGESDSQTSETDETRQKPPDGVVDPETPTTSDESMPRPPNAQGAADEESARHRPDATKQQSISQKRNYFNDDISDNDKGATKGKPLADPAILTALRHAALLEAKRSNADEPNAGSDEKGAATSAAAKRLLSSRDRDFEDMDMGFGSSWAGDVDDADDTGTGKMKLSEWKGLDGDEEDGAGDAQDRGSKQRKRGKKKRKGDKESVTDVLKVIKDRKK
ncbi:MAG: hypothetical protein M1828_007046 [Chrysothrix sp. TS-e1954]|nr:MAG: hypothetical protein M1828_007046 [Chrysothrix sp. TS-e1954]